MTALVRLVVRVHAVLVRLYPQSFRAEFEHEMTSVFAKSVTDTKQRGHLALLVLCLRELFDLPWSLWQEYRHRFDDDRRAIMNQVSDVNHTGDSDYTGPTTPVSWARTLGDILPCHRFGTVFARSLDYPA